MQNLDEKLTMREYKEDIINAIANNTKETLVEFVDRSSTGRIRPWKAMKHDNSLLESVYRLVSMQSEDYEQIERTREFLKSPVYYKRKADRLKKCAAFMNFDRIKTEEGMKCRLKDANFCRIRLCPMCTWRRSLKIASQLREVLEYLERKRNYGYIFITLTVPNVKDEELRDTLKQMHRAWTDYFMKYPAIKKVVKGWFRATEITYNKKRGDWHPHFHCILQVNKSYFTEKSEYLSQKKWLAYWQQAMKDERITQVNVKRIKQSADQTLLKAVLEVAKYSVKPSDYINHDEIDWTAEQTIILDHQLHNLRFAGWGGSFKKARQELKLDDAETGDLTDIGSDNEGEVIDTIDVYWLSGVNQYVIKK